jgi:transcriptional regulator with XRE-family HTH domain
VTDPWREQRQALGAVIRAQRQLANLSLRQLAELTSLSNPYLSQVERGLHEPSVRVLTTVADALGTSAETLLAQAGLIERPADSVETAINAEDRLTPEQKSALITVYRSMLAG